MALRLLASLCVLQLGSLVCVDSLRRDQFGTKTAYEELGTRAASYDQYWEAITEKNRTCQAVHVAGLFRHGERNPSDKYISDIDSLAKLLRNSSSTFDLKNWTNSLTESQEKLLNTVGERELFGLGERTGVRLASLFDHVSIRLTSSDKSRASRSGRKFLEGILPEISHKINSLSVSVNVNNTLLRFYDECDKYIKSVDDNDTALKEVEKQEKGQEIEDMMKRIKSRLGLSADKAIDLLQAKSIYNYCAFETAMFNESVWCDALGDEDLEVMEYYSDLERYWEEGYGYPINYEMACPLVSNIFEGMEEAVENRNEDKSTSANLFFGHSQTLMGLMASLGLYKETKPLMADSMEKRENRTLRASKGLPYSANLVFVLYHCNGSEEITIENKRYSGKYVAKLFHNENEIAFPGCTSGLCPFEFLSSKYANEIKCDFANLCKHVVGASVKNILSTVLIVSAVLLQLLLSA